VSQEPFHVVFAEEDALFRLMEMGLRRALTSEGARPWHFGQWRLRLRCAVPVDRLTRCPH
jgi:hypothetical protein